MAQQLGQVRDPGGGWDCSVAVLQVGGVQLLLPVALQLGQAWDRTSDSRKPAAVLGFQWLCPTTLPHLIIPYLPGQHWGQQGHLGE